MTAGIAPARPLRHMRARTPVTNGCSLDATDVGLCWVHPEDKRTTSHGESHYGQTNSDGTARISYTRRDVGDVSGWSYCADDFISASGCSFNTP